LNYPIPWKIIFQKFPYWRVASLRHYLACVLWAHILILDEFWKGEMIHRFFLGLSVKFNFRQEFNFFKNHIFNYKNYSKINISYTLGVEIKNHLHKTLFIEDFPKIPRKHPNILEILIFIGFSTIKLLNIHWFLHHRFKPQCIPTHGRLFTDAKSATRILWFGRCKFDKTKQRQQTTFLNNGPHLCLDKKKRICGDLNQILVFVRDDIDIQYHKSI
jgi:hypothetical protein